MLSVWTAALFLPEVALLETARSKQTALHIKYIFARRWLSEKLICDNRPRFSRHHLKQFAARCGFSNVPLLPVKSHLGGGGRLCPSNRVLTEGVCRLQA